jgi:hypothetical protein
VKIKQTLFTDVYFIAIFLWYNSYGKNKKIIWIKNVKTFKYFESTRWSKSHATHIKIFSGGCNSVQFDWINKHTISLWLYKSLCRSHHGVTCLRQSVSCLQTVEVQGCLFHKHNKCSLSNTTWHLVLT